ncbi:regulatory protein RecX [Blastococcus sp. VKM Ac-2987]|uniref:regulatory protein RecX n=1 Tax=Blastococcus sp. VKM Ac-2987 TaxID=3004141 RepID=UPI0022AB5C6F|nr:regulatory protein RecX [Blastococcus sp. VKM Ac-2987]MCZ2861058.1 regulatory protein RecX [Blastococcus sp. VKM Ac-2987]
MDDRPPNRRRGSNSGSGFGTSRAGRRSRAPGGDDPLTPDVAPGSPEDDAGDPEQVARAVCLRALTGAPKTRQQLADLLAQREVPDDAAEAVLDRFTEVGLIDDAAFARAWVSSRQAGRGLARRALSAELRAKGVDPDTAAEAVEAVDDDDEREAARRLVARKVGAMRRLDRATATRRLIGMLARKGYNGGLAAAVVREALDEADLAGDVDDVPEFDEESALP